MESVRESLDTEVIEIVPEVSTQEKPKKKRKRHVFTEYEDCLLYTSYTPWINACLCIALYSRLDVTPP